MSQTVLTHQSFHLHSFKDLTLQGMTVSSFLLVSATTTFVGKDLELNGGVRVRNGSSGFAESYTFTNCAISPGSSSDAFAVHSDSNYGSNLSQFNVTLRNSYVFGADTGVNVYDGAALAGHLWPQVNLKLEHNTLTQHTTGLRLGVSDDGHHINALLNGNIFAHSGTGIQVSVDPQYADRLYTYRDENALFGNTQDHRDLTSFTQPGATDVFSDCQLDSAFPPRPAPNSACHDGATGSLATDFFGATRDANPDIGAVELP